MLRGFLTFRIARRRARWLQAHEIDADEGTVTLSREINQSGRSICRIQGVGMPLTMLRELAGTLMDLHGQHEHQSPAGR